MVRLENEIGYKEWTWSDFSTYLESPHFFHLYFNSRSFFLVPKATVLDIQQLGELRKLLALKIKKQ